MKTIREQLPDQIKAKEEALYTLVKSLGHYLRDGGFTDKQKTELKEIFFALVTNESHLYIQAIHHQADMDDLIRRIQELRHTADH